MMNTDYGNFTPFEKFHFRHPNHPASTLVYDYGVPEEKVMHLLVPNPDMSEVEKVFAEHVWPKYFHRGMYHFTFRELEDFLFRLLEPHAEPIWKAGRDLFETKDPRKALREVAADPVVMTAPLPPTWEEGRGLILTCMAIYALSRKEWSYRRQFLRGMHNRPWDWAKAPVYLQDILSRGRHGIEALDVLWPSRALVRFLDRFDEFMREVEDVGSVHDPFRFREHIIAFAYSTGE